MYFGKTIPICLALGFTMSSAHPATATSKTHSHKGYYKPGAAVALTYDYDGETQPGELENLTLTLQHHYSDGYLSARLLETPDLQITSHGNLENKQLQAEISLSLPIQLSGTNTGEYFISLEVIYENLSGERSLRVLSLPIQIGDSKVSKGTTAAPRLKSSGTKGLIILEAQEVIR